MTTRRKSGRSSARSSSPGTGPSATELRLQDDIRLAYANSPNVRLFRNNNGVLTDRLGRYVTYGLGPGTSDLIGWRRTWVHCPRCDELHGPFAIFSALEIKRPGEEPSEKQSYFLDAVALAGGNGFWADSVALALQLLKP